MKEETHAIWIVTYGMKWGIRAELRPFATSRKSSGVFT